MNYQKWCSSHAGLARSTGIPAPTIWHHADEVRVKTGNAANQQHPTSQKDHGLLDHPLRMPLNGLPGYTIVRGSDEDWLYDRSGSSSSIRVLLEGKGDSDRAIDWLQLCLDTSIRSPSRKAHADDWWSLPADCTVHSGIQHTSSANAFSRPCGGVHHHNNSVLDNLEFYDISLRC